MDSEQLAEIARLRALNLSPKQIARKLGLRPAEVATTIKNWAEQSYAERVASGDPFPLVHCKITASAGRDLLNLNPTQENSAPPELGYGSGIAGIVIARQDRNAYRFSSYLVDYWCLGVKDVTGIRKLHPTEYETMLRDLSITFDQAFTDITLEQAQAVIFGAIDYAAKLGFKPHRDFQTAQENLGTRLDNLPELEFGHQGKPFYINGPYDNSNQIIATLQKNVGVGNFECMLQMDSL